MKKRIIFLALLTLLAGSAFAGEPGKFSGYMLGDYYFVAANHNKAIEDVNGFWMRRIYFTYDQKLDDGFSVRLRTEMSSPGDFTTKSTMTPAVKDAYLQWKSGNTKVLFGVSSTPTWGVIESIWGYRSVEKTPLDLQKFGSSRDFGLAVKGKLDKDGRVYYHAMFSNGASNKSETNKQKMIMGALGAWLSDNIVIEGYADYDGRPDHENRHTLQGFIAYKTAKARAGVQVSRQTRQMGVGAEDRDWTIWSAFAAAQVSPKTAVFARVDGNSDPNPDGAGISYIPFDTTAKPTFIVAGLDFTLSSNVHVMPNVEMVTYSAVESGDPEPDSDVIPRVTFFYKF